MAVRAAEPDLEAGIALQPQHAPRPARPRRLLGWELEGGPGRRSGRVGQWLHALLGALMHYITVNKGEAASMLAVIFMWLGMAVLTLLQPEDFPHHGLLYVPVAAATLLFVFSCLKRRAFFVRARVFLDRLDCYCRGPCWGWGLWHRLTCYMCGGERPLPPTLAFYLAFHVLDVAWVSYAFSSLPQPYVGPVQGPRTRPPDYVSPPASPVHSIRDYELADDDDSSTMAFVDNLSDEVTEDMTDTECQCEALDASGYEHEADYHVAEEEEYCDGEGNRLKDLWGLLRWYQDFMKSWDD